MSGPFTTLSPLGNRPFTGRRSRAARLASLVDAAVICARAQRHDDIFNSPANPAAYEYELRAWPMIWGTLWDLGGLAYEMAIRDHVRLDVIVRAAAGVQQVDAELAEVERLLRLEDAAAAGTCPNCGALHSSGAVFCWQCGEGLMEVRPPSAIAPDG